MLTAIVCQLPRHHQPAAVVPCGGGALAARLQGEAMAGNNPFLLHVAIHVLQGVKVPFPQFLLNHGSDNLPLPHQSEVD